MSKNYLVMRVAVFGGDDEAVRLDAAACHACAMTTAETARNAPIIHQDRKKQAPPKLPPSVDDMVITDEQGRPAARS